MLLTKDGAYMSGQKKTKILLVITKSNWGGAQRYVYDIAHHLSCATYQVQVGVGGHGRLSTKLREQGITTHHLSGLQRDISLYRELQALLSFTKLIYTEDPDVLHLNSSKAGLLGGFLGRLLGVPKIIFTAHGWAFNEDRSFFSKRAFYILHWLTVLLSHQTIAVSQAVKDQLKGPWVQKKMTVIHTGIQKPNFLDRETARAKLQAEDQALSHAPGALWSVSVGELHTTKQHHHTIRALKGVAKEGLPVVHIILGEGEERTILEKLIASEGLQNNVFLLGHVPQAEIYLPAFDFLVLPSRSEALGYVLIEACMAKLPIIAARVGGVPEVVGEEDAYLYPTNDIDALARAYKKIFTDQAERSRLAETALRRSAHFEIDSMLKQTTQLY